MIGRGKLTERLLAQGILTPNMLHELKKEWNKDSDGNDDDGDEPKKTTRRKRKFK